jgi:gliding motility-associated-like protein
LLSFTGASVVAGPSVTTVYTVEASWNGYCGSKTTVTVNVLPKPFVFAGRDTTYQLNDNIVLNAIGSGTFEWITGEGILCKTCARTQVVPLQSDCYTVRLTDIKGCVAEDALCIDISRDFNAYIPNTFTPNNDGLNDEFKIYGENLSKFSLTVYNRWGQQLYYSEDPDKGWDGTFKHHLCKEDVYLYKVVYTGLDGKKYERLGSIQLLP